MNPDIYLFGQILGTHSFLLRGGFLQPDAYSEIDAQYFLPGGETGTAATVLSSLGTSVRMAGTHIGTGARIRGDFNFSLWVFNCTLVTVTCVILLKIKHWVSCLAVWW